MLNILLSLQLWSDEHYDSVKLELPFMVLLHLFQQPDSVITHQLLRIRTTSVNKTRSLLILDRVNSSYKHESKRDVRFEHLPLWALGPNDSRRAPA